MYWYNETMRTEGTAPGPHDQNQVVEPTETEKLEQLAHIQELYNQARPYWDHPERLMPNQPVPKEFDICDLEVTAPENVVSYLLERSSSQGWLQIPKDQINSDKRIDTKIYVNFGEQGQKLGVGCYRTDSTNESRFELHRIMERETGEDDALTPSVITAALDRATKLIDGGELLTGEGHIVNSITFYRQATKVTINQYGMDVIDWHDGSKDEYSVSFKDGSVAAYSSKHPPKPLGKINLALESATSAELIPQSAPVDFSILEPIPAREPSGQPVEFGAIPENTAPEPLSFDDLERRVRARQRRIEELRQKLGNPERPGGSSG